MPYGVAICSRHVSSRSNPNRVNSNARQDTADGLFLDLIGIAGIVLLHALSQGRRHRGDKGHILVATMPCPPALTRPGRGTALVASSPARLPACPAAAALAAKPELSDESRAEVMARCETRSQPATRSAAASSSRATRFSAGCAVARRPRRAIPVVTGGASTGLLSGRPRRRHSTQNFRGENARRRAGGRKPSSGPPCAGDDAWTQKPPLRATFGRTVTLDVTSAQAEKINVATEGKLSLILRSASGATAQHRLRKPQQDGRLR